MGSAQSTVPDANFNAAATGSISALPAAGSNVGVERWCKPPAGFMKCNLDATIFLEPNKMGFGGVLRNSDGAFVVAGFGNFPG